MTTNKTDDKVIPISANLDLVDMRKKAAAVIAGTENKWEALKIITSSAFNCIMQIDKSLPGETMMHNMIEIITRSTALYGECIGMISDLIKYAEVLGMRDQMDNVINHIETTGTTVKDAYEYFRKSSVS